MIYIVLLIMFVPCSIASVFYFRELRENKRLKRKIDSYVESLKYKDTLIDELLANLIARNEKKKTELRVKMVDGKMVGYMDGVLLTGVICMGKIADLEWEIAKLKSRGRDNDR